MIIGLEERRQRDRDAMQAFEMMARAHAIALSDAALIPMGVIERN